MKKIILCLIAFIIIYQISHAQALYFPPITSTANWDTVSPSSLGWCVDKIDTLYDYLAQEDSKGFIVLKDGKIVLEKYFGTFTKDSNWYWASAGKTITSFLIGQAQEDGLLSINDSSSKYLGVGWTSCNSAQEANITIKNQLTMTAGLDDGVVDNHCTIDTCLNYLAATDTRWAYHNAPYTLLEKVISNASSLTINVFTQQKLKTPIGMNGIWAFSGFDNIFYSTVRSMARFGLLIQNNGIWNNDTLLHDVVYKTQMMNTSQNLNKSYGYLWWLNGKASFMVPSSQTVFPGSYAPDAPVDMFAGIGKNGQLISVAPSKGIVMIRMGNNASSLPVPFLLCNEIWKRLNDVICFPNAIPEINRHNKIILYPNPAKSIVKINIDPTSNYNIKISNILGKTIYQDENKNEINISTFQNGIYFVSVNQNGKNWVNKFIKE